MAPRTVLVAEHCGFCSGVRNALAAVQRKLESGSGKKVYLLKGLIHNTSVNAMLKEAGCVFVEDIRQIPPGSEAVFGAHGVSPEVMELALKMDLHIADTTCPVVAHLQSAAAAVPCEKELVIAGFPGHPELEGVLAHAKTEKVFVIGKKEEIALLPPLEAPVFLTQTTLNHQEAEELKQTFKTRFPNAHTPDTLCPASRLRQHSVEELAPKCDLFIVAGSPQSSNANRLRETAEKCGTKALLLDSPDEITPQLLRGVTTIGLSAAASTPQSQITALLQRLEEIKV